MPSIEVIQKIATVIIEICLGVITARLILKEDDKTIYLLSRDGVFQNGQGAPNDGATDNDYANDLLSQLVNNVVATTDFIGDLNNQLNEHMKGLAISIVAITVACLVDAIFCPERYGHVGLVGYLSGEYVGSIYYLFIAPKLQRRAHIIGLIREIIEGYRFSPSEANKISKDIYKDIRIQIKSEDEWDQIGLSIMSYLPGKIDQGRTRHVIRFVLRRQHHPYDSTR